MAAGTPLAVRPANIACGTRLVSPMIISEKKIAIEIGMPAFWKVPRMPEATPR